MNIVFKFKYLHNNGLLIRISNRVDELSPIKVNHYSNEDMFYIESSGTQKELEDLAELISSITPQSLFLEESVVEEISELSEVDSRDVNYEQNYEVPYCIECQNSIVDTLNPFDECEVCGFTESKLSVDMISSMKIKDEEDMESYFTRLADVLIENGELELLTYNGKRRFALLDTEEDSNSSILVCDPSNISKIFSLTQGELDVLMMVEKPSVRLKPKVMFYHENELKRPLYEVFFADDTITLALTTALSKKGIVSIYCDKAPLLKASSALGEHVIVHSGRDMLPWRHSFISQQNILCNFGDFSAYVDSSTLTLNKDKTFPSKRVVEFTSSRRIDKKENTIWFEPAHGALRSVVLEHKLSDKALCNIYLSKEHTPNIFSYSPRIGYTPMVKFADDLLSSPNKMIEAIRSMDEAGERLIANYKNTYPTLFETLLSTSMKDDENISMISKLWAIAAHFIGLTSIDDYRTSCEHLEATALEFHGKSGPRIDYKIISSSDGYQLDPRLAIRSAISFKLAGVDEYLLSFGFIDSLADFIAQQAEFADGNIGINGVVLNGSLFENHQLLMRTYNSVSPNYKIYRNKRLSIDGANVAAGAVTLGNE